MKGRLSRGREAEAMLRQEILAGQSAVGRSLRVDLSVLYRPQLHPMVHTAHTWKHCSSRNETHLDCSLNHGDAKPGRGCGVAITPKRSENRKPYRHTPTCSTSDETYTRDHKACIALADASAADVLNEMALWPKTSPGTVQK